MKKLALALALFMPMMFVSCGNDDDENDVPETPEVTYVFENPVQEWGASQTSVKKAITSTNLQLDAETSDAKTLVYTTVTTPYAENLPYYMYNFDNNELDTSSIILSSGQADTDFVTWMTDKAGYYDFGWDEEDQCIYFGNKSTIGASDTIIVYEVLANTNNARYIATWVYVGDEASKPATRAELKAAVRAKANVAAEKALKIVK